MAMLFSGSLFWSLDRLAVQREIVDATRSTGAWGAAQAEAELHRFLSSLDRFGLGDPLIERDDMLLRFEIFWGRLLIIETGAESQELRAKPGAPQAIANMLAELEKFEPRLLALEKGDRENYQVLAAEFRSFYPFLRDLTQFSLVGNWMVRKKLELNLAYLFMMVSFAGIILSTGALIFLFLRQIRQNVAAGRALQEAHNSLELRVGQRTSELVEANATLQQEIAERKRVEEALRLATQDAERASKSKSRFLVAASHDLRQPLQALSLLHRVLSESLSTTKHLQILRDMGYSLTIMADLLNKLLDISKLELGKITPDPENFRVGELLDRVGNPAMAEASAKGLKLRVIPCSAVIFSDRTLLERVMENLISNAIRYTHSGKIVIGCRRRGPNVRIEVWDSGDGIPEDQKQSIFEEYYQIGNTSRNRNLGLGLGLALVQRTTQLLGHALEMESVAGRGSMFSVEVPLGDAVGVPAIHGSAADPVDMEGKLVALIEDDDIVAKATQLLLQQWGLEVIIGADSAETLKALRHRNLRPSLIIADYRLVDGKTGVRETKQLWDALGRMPTIVITGDTGEETLREIEAAGCALLHKPVDPYELQKRTHQMIADAVVT